MVIQLPESKLETQTETGKRQMRSLVYFEQAAHSIFEPRNYQQEWGRVRADLDGCVLQIIPKTETEPTKWVVRGMTKQKAEYYNDRFARYFENALIGLLEERIKLTFELPTEGGTNAN